MGVIRRHLSIAVRYGACELWIVQLGDLIKKLNARTIKDWAERLFDYLRMGYTIEGARELLATVEKWTPLRTDGSTMPPHIEGDKKMKLHGYYESPEGSTLWYRVYPL